MIDLRLDHRQGDFRLDVQISVPAQGITGLIGRSGSGKSTLFGCLAGHIRPTRGCISLRGRAIFNSAERIDVPPRPAADRGGVSGGAPVSAHVRPAQPGVRRAQCGRGGLARSDRRA
ncbi:MAG: ATP-binding cassette domain-containing protein [Maritimibacter sp.]|nr:ATP-binding cassette domain-containing protein [Maritimibacter sp.]